MFCLNLNNNFTFFFYKDFKLLNLFYFIIFYCSRKAPDDYINAWENLKFFPKLLYLYQFLFILLFLLFLLFLLL